MRCPEPCGYVIRYGSFRAMVFSDGGGIGRGMAHSFVSLSGFYKSHSHKE